MPADLRTRLVEAQAGSLVVWKPDRLSRSLKDVLRVGDARAAFRSIRGEIDTTHAR